MIKLYGSLKHTSLLQSLFFYSAILCTTVFILMLYFYDAVSDLSIPFNFSGDVLNHLIIIKAIITHGWWWKIPELSAPNGLHLIVFPISGMLDTVFYKLLALFTTQPGSIINLYFFLSIILSALTAAWAMSRLGISRYTVFCCSILFAIIPQVFYRGELQIWYVAYCVPIVAAFAILIAAGTANHLRSAELSLFYLFCALIGFNYIYFGFFAGFFLLFAIFIAYFQKRKLTLGIYALLILCVAEFFNLFPTSYYWHHDPSTLEILNSLKKAKSTTAINLYIQDIMIPNDYHFLPFLAQITEKVKNAGLVSHHESMFVKIGLAGSVGLILLFLINLTWGKLKITKCFPLLIPIATLNLAGILLATVGGLGYLLNFIIASPILCYNRIAVFLAFFCLCAFAYLLDYTLMTRDGKLKYKLFSLSALLAIFIFGIFDQDASLAMTKDINPQMLAYLTQQNFINKIETVMPCGSRIFQLPVKENLTAHNTANNHLRAYILANHCLSWSWPPAQMDTWETQHNTLPPKEFIKILCQKGFNGLWLDSDAYDGNIRSAVSRYTAILKVKPLVSTDQNFYFFPLIRFCNANK